jgi:hypothetical protein
MAGRAVVAAVCCWSVGAAVVSRSGMPWLVVVPGTGRASADIVTVIVTGFSVVVLVTDIVSVEIEMLYSGFGRLLTTNSAFPKGWIEGMGLRAIRPGGAALAEFSSLATAMPLTTARVDYS